MSLDTGLAPHLDTLILIQLLGYPLNVYTIIVHSQAKFLQVSEECPGTE